MSFLTLATQSMYVDPSSPSTSMKTEQDVNEATAALKGLLGLGVGTIAENRITDQDPVPANADIDPNSGPPPKTPSNPNKKKRNNNKKKKNNDSAQAPEQKQTNGPGASTSTDAHTSKKKKNQKQKIQKEPATYALSAFQSSPDASKLPIPEFSSTSIDAEKVSNEANSVVETSHDSFVNQPVDLLEQTENKILQADKLVEKEPLKEPHNDVAVSATGVNLAALAAKPPHHADSASTSPALPSAMPPHNLPQHPMPVTQHFPPHFGGTNQNLLPYAYHHYPAFNAQVPIHQYQPPHLHHPPYPLPPPPGYMLIQVQIPPVLMPGRQMVVTSPAGFPVQVVVPDGVPAGAWMPVHVPTSPSPMHPQHMMQPTSPPMHNNFDRANDTNRYNPPGH